MLTQQVSFFSEGVRLAGTLTLPDASSGPFKAVVLAHGYSNYRDEIGGFPPLAAALASAKIAAFRFDCRGCGESGGLEGRMLPSTEWVQDLRAALTWLRTCHQIDGEHIGLVGNSAGGSNVVQVGALDPAVRCVVSLCGFADGMRSIHWVWTHNRDEAAWESLMHALACDARERVQTGRSQYVRVSSHIFGQTEQGVADWESIENQFPYFRAYAPYESAESLLSWRPVDFVHRLAPRPVRFIHGMLDTLVPPDEAQDFFAHAGEVKDLQLVQDADHALLQGPFQEKIRALVLEWLEAYL